MSLVTTHPEMPFRRLKGVSANDVTDSAAPGANVLGAQALCSAREPSAVAYWGRVR